MRVTTTGPIHEQLPPIDPVEYESTSGKPIQKIQQPAPEAGDEASEGAKAAPDMKYENSFRRDRYNLLLRLLELHENDEDRRQEIVEAIRTTVGWRRSEFAVLAHSHEADEREATEMLYAAFRFLQAYQILDRNAWHNAHSAWQDFRKLDDPVAADRREELVEIIMQATEKLTAKELAAMASFLHEEHNRTIKAVTVGV